MRPKEPPAKWQITSTPHTNKENSMNLLYFLFVFSFHSKEIKVNHQVRSLLKIQNEAIERVSQDIAT